VTGEVQQSGIESSLPSQAFNLGLWSRRVIMTYQRYDRALGYSPQAVLETGRKSLRIQMIPIRMTVIVDET
jgi:hypothetical protein